MKKVTFAMVLAVAASVLFGAALSGCSQSNSPGSGAASVAKSTQPQTLQQQIQATEASSMPPSVKQHRLQELQMYTGHTQRPSSVVR